MQWRARGIEQLYGAHLTAWSSHSDFALLRLAAPLPASYGAFLNGWCADGLAPSGTAMLHHPAGDLKKVSLDMDPPATAYFGAACTEGGGEGGGEGGEGGAGGCGGDEGGGEGGGGEGGGVGGGNGGAPGGS